VASIIEVSSVPVGIAHQVAYNKEFVGAPGEGAQKTEKVARILKPHQQPAIVDPHPLKWEALEERVELEEGDVDRMILIPGAGRYDLSIISNTKTNKDRDPNALEHETRKASHERRVQFTDTSKMYSGSRFSLEDGEVQETRTPHKTITDLKEGIESYKQKIRSKAEVLQGKREELARLKERLENGPSPQDVQELQERREQKRKLLAEAQDVLAACDEMLAEIKSDRPPVRAIEAFRRSNAAEMKQLAILRAECAELEQFLTQLKRNQRAKIEGVREEIAEKKAEIAASEEDLKRGVQILQYLESGQMQAASDALGSIWQEESDKLSSLRQGLEKLETRLQEIGGFMKLYRALKIECSQLERRIALLNQALSSLQVQYDYRRKEEAGVELPARATFQSLRGEFLARREDLHQQLDAWAQLHKNYIQAMENVEEIDGQLEELEALDLDLSGELLEDLEDLFVDLSIDQEMRALLAGKQPQDAAKAICEVLRSKKEDLSRQIGQWSQELDVRQQSIERTKAEIQEMRKRLAAWQKPLDQKVADCTKSYNIAVQRDAEKRERLDYLELQERSLSKDLINREKRLNQIEKANMPKQLGERSLVHKNYMAVIDAVERIENTLEKLATPGFILSQELPEELEKLFVDLSIDREMRELLAGKEPQDAAELVSEVLRSTKEELQRQIPQLAREFDAKQQRIDQVKAKLQEIRKHFEALHQPVGQLDRIEKRRARLKEGETTEGLWKQYEEVKNRQKINEEQTLWMRGVVQITSAKSDRAREKLHVARQEQAELRTFLQ